jgi:hypothetical protein
MTRQQVEQAAFNACSNALLDRRVKVWRLVMRCLLEEDMTRSGRLMVKTHDDGSRSIVMHSITAINKAFGKPTSIADAGADPHLLQYLFPALAPPKAKREDTDGTRQPDPIPRHAPSLFPPVAGPQLRENNHRRRRPEHRR